MNAAVSKRKQLGSSIRWVVKIGSSLVTDHGRGEPDCAVR